MLGFFTGAAEIISYDAIKKAVLQSVPAKFKELNEQALEKGYTQGVKWRKSRQPQKMTS
jgi:Pyruvate/2-oxoacid:ferredoxin oxidoreductase gamma subunit